MGLASAGAFAQAFTINELFVNPVGTDDGWEYAEIKGTAGASLNGFSFLSIEGDSTAPGTVDRVVDLTGFSIGSNGLLLIRFGTNVSAIEAATTVVTAPSAPNLENDTNTWAIANFLPTLSADLDTNNDGTLDLGSGQSFVDAVGWTDNGSGDFTYGFTYSRAIIGTFTPDAYYQVRGGDAKVFGDVGGTGGLTDFDTTSNEMAIYSSYRGTNGDGVTVRDNDWENWADSGFGGDPNVANILKLTPGGVNPVPEPASMAVLGLGILGLARRRRNK